MAGNVLCSVCQENPAEVLVINSSDGSAADFCANCYALTGLLAAKALLPAELIADTLGPMFVKVAEPASEAARAPKAAKSKAPPPQAEKPPTEPAPGVEEAPATASDG